MTEDAFYEHRLWALVRPDGEVVEVVRGDAEHARELGERYGPVVIDAEGEREDAYEPTELVANPERRALPTVRESPRAALKEAQLPSIDLKSLFRKYPLDRRGTPWGDGLRKAHEEIRPFFPTFKRTQRIERWQDPVRTVEELCAATEKMKKPVPLPDGTTLPVYAFGLMLAPNVLAFQSGIGVKVPGRRVPKNYDLTFSYSGEPKDDPSVARARRRNLEHEVGVPRRVAVVFLARKGDLPERFRGLPVVDGDLHDYRPLDPPNPEDPRPCCVGLTWKPPSGRSEAARRMKDFAIFAVPVYEEDGRFVAAETPRYTLLPSPSEDD